MLGKRKRSISISSQESFAGSQRCSSSTSRSGQSSRRSRSESRKHFLRQKRSDSYDSNSGDTVPTSRGTGSRSGSQAEVADPPQTARSNQGSSVV